MKYLWFEIQDCSIFIKGLLIFLLLHPRRCFLSSELLPLVIFTNYHLLYSPQFSAILKMNHPWEYFKICELKEVVRQQGDTVMIDLLNNLRLGNVTGQLIKLLGSRVLTENFSDYPYDAVHMLAENLPKNKFNSVMLNVKSGHAFPPDICDKGLSKYKFLQYLISKLMQQ